jgi:hypothetical protein
MTKAWIRCKPLHIPAIPPPKAHDGTPPPAANAAKQMRAIVEEWERRALLNGWHALSLSFLAADGPKLRTTVERALRELDAWIAKRIWPSGFPKIRKSIEVFGRVLGDLLTVFDRHTEPRGDFLQTTPFYKLQWHPTEKYLALLEDYQHHTGLIDDLTLELTRSANLVCDRVREELDPDFRMNEGLLSAMAGPFQAFDFRELIVQYPPIEKELDPYPGLEAFAVTRFERDMCMADKGGSAGPSITARFDLNRNGNPIWSRVEEGYRITLGLARVPREVSRVVYRLDPTHTDPVRELGMADAPGFFEKFTSWGDCEIEAEIQIGKFKRTLRKNLSQILRDCYPQHPESSIVAAIAEISKN